MCCAKPAAVVATVRRESTCTATHCNTLQHITTRCNTLQHTATHCNTLQHTATHCNTLQHTATHCNIPGGMKMCCVKPAALVATVRNESTSTGNGISGYARTYTCCSVLQCVTVWCSVLQCVTVRFSVLKCVALAKVFPGTLAPARDAVCCSVLQCVTMCCSVVQYVIVCCIGTCVFGHACTCTCCSVLQ